MKLVLIDCLEPGEMKFDVYRLNFYLNGQSTYTTHLKLVRLSFQDSSNDSPVS